jgi:hypothetical protein
MPLSDDVTAALGSGEAYSFADWPNPDVPRFGVGVYTVWHVDGRFIYVGMSGRGMTQDTVIRNSPFALYTRLAMPADAGAAISSASMWPTASCFQPCIRWTSRRFA